MGNVWAMSGHFPNVFRVIYGHLFHFWTQLILITSMSNKEFKDSIHDLDWNEICLIQMRNAGVSLEFDEVVGLFRMGRVTSGTNQQLKKLKCVRSYPIPSVIFLYL